MNSTPFKKRTNPLDSTTAKPQAQPQPQQEVKSVETVAPAPVQTRKSAQKQIIVVEERIKYTATMDKAIRRRLKLAAAKRDVQISEFIEEAVLEKLEREGD